MRVAPYHLPALWWLVLLSALVAECTSDPHGTLAAAEPVKGTGTLAGKVVRAPASPAQPGNTPSALPAPGVTLSVRAATGQAVQSVVTDAQGDYSLRLPAGSYHIEMGPLTGIEFTKNLPTMVTIQEGQVTPLHITIDSGMR